MIHGKVTCPKCSAHFEISLTNAPAQQAQRVAERNGDSDLADLLDRIDEAQLNGQAADFISQTKERFAKYKDNTKMSEKQMAWLRKIVKEQESGEAF